MERYVKRGLLFLFLMFVCATSVQAGGVSSAERAALVDLFKDTEGKSWTDNTGWLDGDPCNDAWYGITCSADGSHITKITLPHNNLQGTLSDSIGDLHYLIYLNLNYNHLSGRLPSTIVNLTSLSELYLDYNNFEGEVNDLFILSSLIGLSILENSFTGTISDIGKLEKAHYINLGSNQLYGTIPSNISQLVDIRTLELYNNDFTGTIPASLTSLDTTLKTLNLAYNRLSGEIPSGIQDMSLDFLYLVHNCNLYSNDQSLIDYINANFSSKYNDIISSNECSSSQNSVYMAPIISYLLSDTGALPPKPVEPTGVQVTPVNLSSDKLRITWTDNSDNETSFDVYRSLTVDGTRTKVNSAPLAANTTSFEDNGLTGCRTYYYWVAAKNAGGSSLSEYGSGTTAPAAPANFSAVGREVRSIYFYWDSVSCAVKYHFYSMGDIADGYGPYNRLNESEDITGTSATLTNQVPDKYVFYRISAEDAYGHEGSMSCQVAANAMQGGATSTYDTCHAAVAWAHSDSVPGASGTYNTYTDHVVIQWNAVPTYYDENNVPTAWMPYYKVYECLNAACGSSWTVAPPNNPPTSDPMSLFINVPSAGRVYYYSIRAFYSYYGTETLGDPINVVTRTADASGSTDNTPGVPWLMASPYYPNYIMVGWGSVYGATRYELQRSMKSDGTYGAFITIYNGGWIEQYNDNVGAWKECHYRVRACNSSGICSGWSDTEYGNSSGI